MSQSFFTYNVTRSYPYRWFTWVVVFGGIAAAAILSVVNVAANGYEPGILTTTNPNSTELPEHLSWFQKKPWSEAVKVSSKCQDQTLVVGSQLYTDNFGLPYTINALYRNGSEPRASCAYHHDYLHDCRIVALQIIQSNRTIIEARDGTRFDISANINCTLYEDTLPMTMVLDLSSTIYGNPTWFMADPGAPLFLSTNNSDDNSTQSSLYIGQGLMNFYTYSADDHYTSQQMPPLIYRYRLNPEESLDAEDYAFVHIGFADQTSITLSSADLANPIEQSVWLSSFGQDLLLLDWRVTGPDVHGILSSANHAQNTSNPFVKQFVLIDSLAKSVYFTILSDLGQSSSTNALASAQEVMSLWYKTVQVVGVDTYCQGGCDECVLRYPNISLAEFYKCAKLAMPVVNPATVWMQYTCQVPKLKSTGSLVISVIVADLVFLQALWLLLNWITTFFVCRREPEANYCTGCMRKEVESEAVDHEMTYGKTSSDHDAPARTIAFSSSRSYTPYQPLPQVVSRSPSSRQTSTLSFTNLDRDELQHENATTIELFPRDQRESSTWRDSVQSPGEEQDDAHVDAR